MNKSSYLVAGLERYHLSGIGGSPFDNAYEIFGRPQREINLISLGTNGNMTDSVKTNAEWVHTRAAQPEYCHLTSGDWGKSPLRQQLLNLPDALNTSLGAERFSKDKMILTNGLLLASNGVSDIENQFRAVKERTPYKRSKDLVNASMGFFDDSTLKDTCPEIIFAYGNADAGHSAWRYLRNFYREIKPAIKVLKNARAKYKFCTLEIHDREVTIIGAAHPCYHYNHLEPELIRQGLDALKVLDNLS